MPSDVCPSVLAALRPPRVRNAADWADQEGYLPASDAHSGKFRCRPYQTEILKAMSIGSRMKASGGPIKEVVLLKSAQVGYTISLLHAISYTVLHRPTNIGFYFPTNDSMLAFASNQAARYFDSQPALKGKISSEVSSDGKSSATRKHFDNGTLRFLSAHKPADVATHSFGYVMIDEYDLVKDIKGEGSSFDLIKNRTQEFHDAIVVVGGTPRGDFMDSNTWKLYDESDKRRFMIRCPKCGKPQYLAIQQFVAGASDYNDSGFKCINEDCNYLMKEHEKPRLIKEGYWKTTSTEGIPGRAGFHISSLYSDSPNCSWPNLARQREAANYDKENLRVFINTRLGLPASQKDFGHVQPQDILDQVIKSSYETVYGTDALPNDISLITCGVDVQGNGTPKDRLEYSLYGFSRTRCYLLAHLALDGNVLEDEVWAALREVVTAIYTTDDKKKAIRPAIAFVDSGNGNTTMRVYRQCKKLGRTMFPIKGNITPGKAMVVKGFTPATKQPLFHIQTALVKDKIMAMLNDYTSGNPEAQMQFPVDLDPFVAAGLCSEHREVQPGGKVIYVHNKVDRNEPLDCAVYAIAAKEHHIGAYDHEQIWKVLDKKALVDKGTRKAVASSKGIDFGGFV